MYPPIIGLRFAESRCIENRAGSPEEARIRGRAGESQTPDYRYLNRKNPE